jgi:hypothetical protein
MTLEDSAAPASAAFGRVNQSADTSAAPRQRAAQETIRIEGAFGPRGHSVRGQHRNDRRSFPANWAAVGTKSAASTEEPSA